MILKDEVYLNVAKEISRLSKDENTKVGAVIVDKEGRVVSTGRNGTVAGLDDSLIPHSREPRTLAYIEQGVKKTFESNKYPFMRHAEENAIAFSENMSRLEGSTMYATGMPCPKCALAIAQHKIARVVITPEAEFAIKMLNDEDKHVSKYIFAMAGIVFEIGDSNKHLLK
jgi:dCMP deaminase